MTTLQSVVPTTSTILIVDDEPSMLRYLRTLLEVESYRIETVPNAKEALDRLHHQPLPDLVLLDLLMPGMDGLAMLQRARDMHPDLKVIMLSCVGDSRKIAQAVRCGAIDYLCKPFEKEELLNIVRELLAVETPCSAPLDEPPEIVELDDNISFICGSPAMRRVREQCSLVATFDMPVLLVGESGSGKEVLSLLIHRMSPRANQTFLKVNCAAVPNELLESELFGYEPGAFTGAVKAKPGKFELCEGGTILLDEIGEMPPALQAKLLHVLQDHQFSRLGSSKTVKADVRILAATNINIQEALATKRLREDLYYRLNGFTLNVPPLRERKKEIPLLLKHFMNRMAERYGRQPVPFNQRLMRACVEYSWPGNLRQLENFVKRYLVLADETAALLELRSDRSTNGLRAEHPMPDQIGLKSLARSVKNEAEAEAIARVLEQTNWHRQKAAALLRISYKALLYKIRQYGLKPPDEKCGTAHAS
ncbi:MAG TPA: sigma-54 dependent transcriptional regulator [Terriglobales bacterium]|nr:sigma-54 dependent transcriptional regulator [Terriglobales bacterium]